MPAPRRPARPTAPDRAGRDSPAIERRRRLPSSSWSSTTTSDIARFVEVNLRLQGFEVLLAHDGEEALELIEQHRPGPGDRRLMMPQMDGLELTRRLRADPMTARAADHHADRARA